MLSMTSGQLTFPTQAQPARTGGGCRFHRVRACSDDLCRRKEYSLFPQKERELIHTYLQVSLSKDGEFVATKWQIYLLYLAILFVHGMLNVRDPPSMTVASSYLSH